MMSCCALRTTCVWRVKHITVVGTGTRKTNSPAGNNNTDNLHNHSITADFDLSRKGRRTRPPFPSTYPIAGVQFKYAWSVITARRQVRLSLATDSFANRPSVCLSVCLCNSIVPKTESPGVRARRGSRHTS